MSSGLDHISTLYFTPYKTGPLLAYFYEHLTPSPKNILLTYLVLPLVLTPGSRRKLKNSDKRSNLVTFSTQKEMLFGLQDKVIEFKERTNKCLLLLIENKTIILNKDLSVSFNDHQLEGTATPKDYIRASKNLGTLLNEYNVVECYRMLGLQKL